MATVKDTRAASAATKEVETKNKEELVEVKKKIQPPAFFTKVKQKFEENKGKVIAVIIGGIAAVGTVVIGNIMRTHSEDDLENSEDLREAEDADFTEVNDEEVEADKDAESLS